MDVQRPGLIGMVAICNMLCVAIAYSATAYTRSLLTVLLSPTYQIVDLLFERGKHIENGDPLLLVVVCALVIANGYLWGIIAWTIREAFRKSEKLPTWSRSKE